MPEVSPRPMRPGLTCLSPCCPSPPQSLVLRNHASLAFSPQTTTFLPLTSGPFQSCSPQLSMFSLSFLLHPSSTITQSHPSGFGLNATHLREVLLHPDLRSVPLYPFFIDAWALTPPIHIAHSWKLNVLTRVSAALHVYTVRHGTMPGSQPRLTSLVGLYPWGSEQPAQQCQAPAYIWTLSFTVLPTVNWQIVGLS